MNKLKAIVVDDEKISRDILQNYISKYCPIVEVIAQAENIEIAYELIQENELDIVFLDVEMPFGNAFDLLDKLEVRNFETIFVTAYDHYAIEALNNDASYYLLKPISIDELIKAVAHVESIITKEKALENKMITPSVKTVTGKITIPQQDGFQILDVADILYCKADDNYTEIHVKQANKAIVASKTLKHFESMLTQYAFARIHKSYLVNVNEVIKYKKGKGGSVVLSNQKEVLVSASKKGELLKFFA